MQLVAPWLASVALACYVIRDAVKTYRDYAKLKQGLALGDPEARPRFYMQILQFEWISAGLALVALGFDKTKLVATRLQMRDTAFGHWVSTSVLTGSRGTVALTAGLLIGWVLMAIVRLRARRRPTPPESAARPWWLKLVPEVAPLIPTTARERLLFSAISFSAGICEEIVFRGWLLFTLHTSLGFKGTVLIFLASALFGLCHVYQGLPGVVGTTGAGVLLCALYIGTGTLLVPMVVHTLIDLRAAILPTSGGIEVPRGQPARG